MPWPFLINHTYSRRDDVHRPYKGQERSGIVTPKGVPGIFIFTGHGGGAIGYQDTFQPDGSLRYTGEGQIGDMRMAKGNLAIHDHAANGKDLLVFQQLKKGSGIRFLGLFVCTDWGIERQPDLKGTERDAIVFTLTPLENAYGLNVDRGNIQATADLNSLRQRAIAAAAPAQGKQAGKLSTLYVRSRDVRNYVLARANGVCEGCSQPAPFHTVDGFPFLEAHHIRRLTDGGPDDPKHVAGICPNCHRRAHYSSDCAEFNQDLAAKIARREEELCSKLSNL